MVAHCQRFALLRISRTRDRQRAEQYFRLRPCPRPETFGGTAFRQSNLAQTVIRRTVRLWVANVDMSYQDSNQVNVLDSPIRVPSAFALDVPVAVRCQPYPLNCKLFHYFTPFI